MVMNRIGRCVVVAALGGMLGCTTGTSAGADAAKGSNSPAPLTKPSSTKPATAPSTQPFEKEIQAFEAADRKSLPAPGGIVFYGSSSIKRWQTLKTDFPDLPVINRGFGGSSAPDAIKYVDRAVIPLKPSIIVFYEGDNDLGKGRTPEQFVDDCKTFAKLVHDKLPQTRILYLAIKPSVKRESLFGTQKKANGLLEAWVKEAKNPNLEFIDVFTPMLDETGKVKPDLFVSDNLHMKPESYKLWVKVIEPRLKAK
ncbi:GDSL-type esterase/lipase family protein [Humisphaera borealis]|uniref:SGNH hydrolase-type esterase domain-containing protein n=1 Tax=Humisphaera borealis TaxID=2807512 RepID=A0A7M2WUC3_9BACT|nr:GDSL-type esterase/lipase family protein [Humisphaera borealis]QOV89086.1 hypothetical protein IPV69_23160 [Humisphaera borealis]